MKLVDSIAKQGTLIQSFWFTHHVCFCAIVVVYIYTIQQHRLLSTLEPAELDTNRVRSLFSLAEVCQQHLAEATRKNCPSRRYGIILEETRLEVHKQLGTELTEGSLANNPEQSRDMPIQDRSAVVEQRPVDLTDTNNAVPINSISYDGSFPSSAFVDGPLEMGDVGFLDNLEGSIWWTQLDTWVGSPVLWAVLS